ncbi:hypothetical protein [Flavihumibacter petaseus]|uniref:6-phosphogluconate dehydrogenase n=1 Tax=Flavihumibacter petaseus NBRC 106054 TaxID=1220578 RepID=A0A0E9MVU9_9BACT|nr:hypothetical protein [Flavihumibacter petaseus]GAO41623.1 hypothetical protein FPE01S_01_06370 [Flavihumibacter petaseus NBRC 106054]
MRRVLTYILVGLIVFGFIFFYWRFYWVFGEGVKAGELNFLVKKGYIFKTYEGKLIQSGFKGGVAGSIQSYEFEFSVTNEAIASQLMNNSGKIFELHYKEYQGSIPWRGNSEYVVDSILSMRASVGGPVINPKPAQ